MQGELKHDNSPTRFLAGSGRSGTTWVLDCLADSNSLRPIFEPLHPATSKIGARYAYRALAPGDPHPELADFLIRVQEPGVRTLWTTYRGRPDRLMPRLSDFASIKDLKDVARRWKAVSRAAPALHQAANRRIPLVKCIRANLALGWLVRQLGARVAMIIRHPCAVVESQFRLGRNGSNRGVWDPYPIVALLDGDRNFHESTEDRYRSLLAGSLTRIEAITLLWIIENQLPVCQARDSGFIVLAYEDLLEESDATWRRLCDQLNLSCIPSTSMRGVPSQQSSDSSPKAESSSQPGWMRRINAAQRDEVQKMLDRTEFDLYHTASFSIVNRSLID